MDFALSRVEHEMIIDEINHFGDLITAFEDTGAYSGNPQIIRSTHQIKTSLKDLKSGLENESVTDGPGPGKSLVLDTIRKGRSKLSC